MIKRIVGNSAGGFDKQGKPVEIKVIYYNVVEGTLIKTATCEHNSTGAKQLMIQRRGNPDKKPKRLVVTMKYVLVAVSCREHFAGESN